MASPTSPAPPVDRAAITDLYFLEHRAKLIDIAAFIDRADRATGDDDFRMSAFRAALTILDDGRPERARRILEHFSDHSTEPIPSAAGMKGAHGAPLP